MSKLRREQIMIRNYFENPITKRFIDAFPQFERTEQDDTKVYFYEGWQASPFYDSNLTKDDLKHVYYHLRAAYYNWHFIYMDDRGISDNIYHIIEEFYPNCKERLSLVSQLRAATLDEFKDNGTFIDSTGQNPKTTTNMNKLIDIVDTQNASFQFKSKEQAIRAKFNSLYDGVMEAFIERFKPLFVKLYSGVNDYLYKNPIDEEE